MGDGGMGGKEGCWKLGETSPIAMYASGEDVRGLCTSNAHENSTPDADTGGVYADNNTERDRMSEWRREGRRENTYDVAPYRS